MSNNPGKNEELDKIYCQSISKSISDVILFSLDESFRKRSFELFGVSCTADTEKEIYKKLMTLIENKNSKKNRGVEDEELMEVDPPDPLPGTSTDKVTQIQSKNTKRSWLQISSQQFRESIKRRRTCFYSQPDNWKDFFGCSDHQKNFEVVPNLFRDGDFYNKEKCKKSFDANHIMNIRHFSQ